MGTYLEWEMWKLKSEVIFKLFHNLEFKLGMTADSPFNLFLTVFLWLVIKCNLPFGPGGPGGPMV